MILAAGFGKRMMPLTVTCPKPLLKVGEKSLIEYRIDALVDAGVKELVVNHAYLGQQIVDALGDGSRWGIRISYSAEGEPLETAGGIAKALPLLGESPFIIVNSDIWCDFDFTSLVSGLDAGQLAHLVLVDNPAHNPKGDFALGDSRRIRNQGEHCYTYSGIAVISPQLFSSFDVYEGPLAPLLRAAIDQGLVTGELHQGIWHDIGTPERLDAINTEHQQALQNAVK